MPSSSSVSEVKTSAVNDAVVPMSVSADALTDFFMVQCDMRTLTIGTTMNLRLSPSKMETVSVRGPLVPNGNGGYRKPKLTLGQRAADVLSRGAGSWSFLIVLSLILGSWILFNLSMPSHRWDPYPFILLNLFLSFMAAYQAPIILMSQGRTEDRDRVKSERDHAVNRKAEREIEDVQRDLEEIKTMIRRLDRKVSEVRRREEKGTLVGPVTASRLHDPSADDAMVGIA